LNPFAVIQKMRRSVESNFITCRLQRRRTQRRRGALALRPCHVDDRNLHLRVAETFHQREHALKVEIRFGQLGGMFEAIIHERVKVIEGEVIGGFGIHARDCKT